MRNKLITERLSISNYFFQFPLNLTDLTLRKNSRKLTNLHVYTLAKVLLKEKMREENQILLLFFFYYWPTASYLRSWSFGIPRASEQTTILEGAPTREAAISRMRQLRGCSRDFEDASTLWMQPQSRGRVNFVNVNFHSNERHPNTRRRFVFGSLNSFLSLLFLNVKF